MANKEYLGDGVYVNYNGWAIVLTAEDGIRVTNEIFLEGSVFQALADYVKRLKTSPELDSPSQSLDRIDGILAEAKAEDAHSREVEDVCGSCGARTFSGICSAKCGG
jgi:hypothetical protein